MERTYANERAAHARAVAGARGRHIGPPDAAAPETIEYAKLLEAQGDSLGQIASSRDGLAEGEVAAEGKAGANGFGGVGYLGPAPSAGDKAHRYVFRLLAVDQSAELTDAPSYHDVEAAVAGHVLAEAQLFGTYRR